MTQKTDRIRRVLLWVAAVLTLWATWWVGQEEPVAPVAAQPAQRIAARAEKAATAAKSAKTAKTPMEVPVVSWPVRASSSAQEDVPVDDLFALPAPARVEPLSPQPVPPPPPPEFRLRYVGEYHDGVQRRFFLVDALEQVTTVESVGNVVDGDWELSVVEDHLLQFRHRSTGFLHTVSLENAP
ncbi:hypothetical protein [Candidatus Symbiobacter mobilis]|uniref:Uncharacterized protein n=1 Tax=Candidatus Symbiobacter mobilis CR TaxID=946483 RepID=U5NAC2_9BURK|nr:hypothetical protein [Candidatus Symbiobacter mobilis]AGX87203.1 hypothetical protein Cenrod_1110 [Candidatus Symbiobacter mobilis CR]